MTHSIDSSGAYRCVKCGTLMSTGQSSCCAPGGSWFAKCGDGSNSTFEYTFTQGIKACANNFPALAPTDEAELKLAIQTCTRRSSDCANSLRGPIAEWNVSGMKNMDRLFQTEWKFNGDISKWDVSGVTSMQSMFDRAVTFNGALSNWDVSNVINMRSMFERARSFNGDISKWDVSSVKKMNSMFKLGRVFAGDISKWDVSSVANTNSMFYQALSFNNDLSKWKVSRVTSMNSMFRRAKFFTGDISTWDVSSVTDMSYLFVHSLFKGDISKWDVSSVKNMTYMFEWSSFNGDISKWDTSEVASMAAMFQSSKFATDISRWDVSKVTDMSNMFFKTEFSNGDLSNWDVSSVTSMKQMFHTSKFSGDISEWDVSRVTSMSGMFSVSFFNGDISKWNTSQVRKMDHMFNNARSFKGDISRWDVSSVVDMSYMFYGHKLFQGDLSKWDVSNAVSMASMFQGAFAFSCNISMWDVSRVKNMIRMFYQARAFDSDISNWDVSSVTQTTYMFYFSAFSGDVSKWDVSGVIDMQAMFFGTGSFNSDISKWDVSRVTTMTDMFYMSSFNGDISKWDVSRVKTFVYMFHRAKSFNCDISKWDVSRATHMGRMFHEASAFNSDISWWDVWRVSNMELMFCRATSFNSDLSKWDVSKVINMRSMFRGATAFNSDLSGWQVSKVFSMEFMFKGATSFDQILCGRSWLNSKARKTEMFSGSSGSIQKKCKLTSSTAPRPTTTRIKDHARSFLKQNVELKCPKCGIFEKSLRPSCCAPGGAWYDNCGSGGDSDFNHTWFEGIQTCVGSEVTLATTTSTNETSTSAATSSCSQCGIFRKSGIISCCAPGGVWSESCGSAGDSDFNHTWFEGIQACVGRNVSGTTTKSTDEMSMSAATITISCSQCGIFKKSGIISCCAPGGAWSESCGSAGDTDFNHTWFEGIQACVGRNVSAATTISINQTSTSAAITTSRSSCSQCGIFMKSGIISCCAPGGAWSESCGSAGDSDFNHTWFEGIQACVGRNVSEPTTIAVEEVNSAAVTSSSCSQCGIFEVSRRVSCCAPGGAWYKDCSKTVRSESGHTWIEGIRACKNAPPPPTTTTVVINNASAATTGTPCDKCGILKSGLKSCCARGGSWFKKCGSSADPKFRDISLPVYIFHHTWFEGIQACKGSLSSGADPKNPIAQSKQNTESEVQPPSEPRGCPKCGSGDNTEKAIAHDSSVPSNGASWGGGIEISRWIMTLACVLLCMAYQACSEGSLKWGM